MAAVLQFRRKAAPVSWANEELAEFYRIVDVMGRAGLAISVEVGVTDEGEPWVAFVREDTGDVLAHIARIDGWVVAVSAASNEVVRAQSLKEVVRRIVDTHPLVLLPAHRPGSHIHVHPCAVLAAFIAAAYVLAEGVQSEVHAREFAVSMSADHAAASAATASTAAAVTALPPSKVAAHPNPLRSALTSISDFLRGVGDLAQPVALNATSANAAIAAVVALVLSGDDTGGVAAHASTINQAAVAASMLADAAASAAEAREEAAARSSASQHVVGLDSPLTDQDMKADVGKVSDHGVETRQATTGGENATTAQRDHAQADVTADAAAQAQIKPIESAARLSADLSVFAHAAAVVAAVDGASDRAVKPAAAESISTAPSTVAGTAASSAAKSDYASGASSAITASTASASTRASSSDSAADHNGLHGSGQGETTVLRLSDISKYALSALRISDALISALDQVTVSTAKIDVSDASIVTKASLNGDSAIAKTGDISASVVASASSTGSGAAASTPTSVDLTTSVVKAPLTNAAHIEASDGSAATSLSSGTVTGASTSATAASAASVVTPASQSATLSATDGQTTNHPSTAYDIITGILTFAFGDHPSFVATDAARAEISQDLARHGMSTTSQRVLIFSSETVTVPVFELTPGVVLVDGREIANANRSAHALDITSASKVIYLPDGGTLNLIGVIDFPIAT